MQSVWTLREILGGGGEIFNMYAFGVHLRYANLSNIMLGISNSLFNYCNVTITFHLLLNNANCDIWYHYFYRFKLLGGGGGGACAPLVPATVCSVEVEEANLKLEFSLW